jgi:hypothetical protein
MMWVLAASPAAGDVYVDRDLVADSGGDGSEHGALLFRVWSGVDELWGSFEEGVDAFAVFGRIHLREISGACPPGGTNVACSVVGPFVIASGKRRAARCR